MDLKQLGLYAVSGLLFIIIAFVVAFMIKAFMRRKATVDASLPSLEEVNRTQLAKKMSASKEEYDYEVEEPDMKDISEVSDESAKYLSTSTETSLDKDFGGDLTKEGTLKPKVQIKVGENIDLPEL